MKAKIKLRRGAAASVPTLSTGEIGFSTDTKDIYVGSSSGNAKFLNSSKTVTNVKYDSETGKVIKTIDGTDYDAFDLTELAEHDYPGVYSGYVTKKASGSIVHIEDGADSVPLKAFDFDIEPIQDLHGYDKPWPDGGGKNKLKPYTRAQMKIANTSGTWSGDNYTVDGVTFACAFDNQEYLTTVTPSGTASAQALIWTASTQSGFVGDYKLSGGIAAMLYITAQKNGNWIGVSSAGNDVSITGLVSTDLLRVCCVIEVNKTGTGVFKPMLREASVADSAFAPYSNECPIDGYTGAEIPVTGINVWDEEWELGGISIVSGNPFSSNSRIRSKNLCPIKGGQNYYYKGTTHTTYLLFYRADESFISALTVNTSNVIAVPEDAHYFKLSPEASYGTTYNHDISINYPSTDTDYHSGADNKVYSVSWSEQGTVYKGTAKYKGSGVWKITSTHGEVDMGSLSWTYAAPDTSRPYGNFYAGLSGKKYGEVNLISSMFKTLAGFTTDFIIHGHTNSANVYVVDSAYTDAATFTTAVTGQTLVYELATPVTFTVSGPDPLTLLGENYIFNSVGDTDLTYRRDPEVIEAHLTELDALKEENAELNREVLASYPIDTIENAAIASFPDGADDISVKELTVGIESTQDLHGQVSPYPPNGGKNKLPMTLAGIRSANTGGTWSGNVYSVNGGTFTVVTDDGWNITEIRANGTFSEQSTFYLCNNQQILFENNAYVLNGVTGGSDTTYYIMYVSPSWSYRTVTNGDATMNVGAGISKIRIDIAGNYTANNVVFKPMVRLITESDATFAPYSNICPIYSQAEKNLLPMTLASIKAANTSVAWVGNTYTFNGVKWEVVTDENDNVLAINASGSATSNSPLYLTPAGANTFNGDILTGCPIGGGGGSYHIFVYAESLGSADFDYGSGANVTIANGASVQVLCRIVHDYAISGTLTFKPMIRNAANPDPTFVPYRCVARVDEYGKNLLGRFVQGYLSTTDGKSASYNANWVYTPDYIKIAGGTTIRVSATRTNSSVLFTYDKNMNFLGAYQLMTNATVGGKTLDADVAFFRFSINIAGGSIPITPAEVPNYKFQLEIGTEATEYEAFKDRTYFSLAKDVWDQQWEVGTYSSADGTPGTASKIRSKNMIPILPETRYYYYNGAGYGTEVFFYNANKEFIYYTAWGDANRSYATPTDAYYMNIAVATSYGTTYNGDIAILTAPPEIWGGELNVTTGELKVTDVGYDMGSLSWVYDTRYSVLSVNTPIPAKNTSGSGDIPNMMCSMFKVAPINSSDSPKISGLGTAFVNQIYVYGSSYTDAAAFITAVTGQTLVYELATPQIFHLDPVDVKTWLAANNIMASTGDIVKLEYRADTGLYVTKKLASLS